MVITGTRKLKTRKIFPRFNLKTAIISAIVIIQGSNTACYSFNIQVTTTMSYNWSFSQSSLPLLQKCIDAAAKIPPDNSNKFLKLFGPRNLDLIKKPDNTIVIEDSPEMEISIAPQNNEDDLQKIAEEFIDADFDLVSKFDSLPNKCCKYPKLLSILAETLPTDTIDKFNDHIFNNTSIESKFLEIFYEYFLPAYIGRDNSRFSTELLIKTHKLHPQYFKILLKCIFKDVNIQNSIINDFILTLDSDELTKLLNSIGNMDLSEEEFKHCIHNIHTAYKRCNKTDTVQNILLTILKTHSVYCTSDKNYGKLFLAYLQQEKSLSESKINCTEVRRIIGVHTSPFKRLCLVVLEEINNAN